MATSVLFEMHQKERQADLETFLARRQTGRHCSWEMARLIQRCTESQEELQEFWRHQLKDLMDGLVEATHVNQVRQTFWAMFRGDLEFMKSIQEEVQLLQQAGQSVSGAADLENAIRKTERLRDDVFRYWDESSEEDLRLAREEVARGEGLELTDAFAEVAGVDRDTWRYKVEEYQRSRATRP